MAGYPVANVSVRCAVSRSGRAICERSGRSSPIAIKIATPITAKASSWFLEIMRWHRKQPSPYRMTERLASTVASAGHRYRTVGNRGAGPHRSKLEWTPFADITSRRSNCVRRQGELKRGAVWYVCRGPQPAIVAFHDRTADREPHTHAARFGSEEGVEQPVRVFGGDPDAAIRHAYEHLLCLVLAGSDHQFARPIRDRLHGFNAIHHQVDDHLLQLDPIGQGHGERGCQLHLQPHLVADQLTLQH